MSAIIIDFAEARAKRHAAAKVAAAGKLVKLDYPQTVWPDSHYDWGFESEGPLSDAELVDLRGIFGGNTP